MTKNKKTARSKKAKPSRQKRPLHTLPIYLTNWTVEYRAMASHKPKIEQVSGVVSKGVDPASDPDCLRHAIYVLKERKSKIDDATLSHYTPVHVELVKQVGYGVKE